jgi:hypothetical protein
LNLGKPAGLETAKMAHREENLRRAAPQTRGTAGESLINRCFTTHRGVLVIFPPEPPVASMLPAERPGARGTRFSGSGAPAFGAAERTLDGEDRSGIGPFTTGGFGGKITFPAGELRAGF